MNINELTDSEIVRLDGEYNGKQYWLDVVPLGITPALREALHKNAEEALLLPKELAKRIVNWSLFDKEEGDLPPSEEVLCNFREKVIANLFDTVAQSWTGDKKKQTHSPNGSAAKAS